MDDPLPLDATWDDQADETFTVAALSRVVERAVRRAASGAVWVRGEMQGLKRAASGHVYFDLVDSEAGDPKPKIGVALLMPDKAKVNDRLRGSGAVRMADGLAIRIRASLGYWAPSNQVRLRMVDVDPEYTLGRLAADRDRLLRDLASEGLLDANAGRPIPMVPLDLAVVASSASAGWEDFCDELARSGVGFRVRLWDTRVQGVGAGGLLATAVRAAAAHRPDVIALIRGGGARSDLAPFDAEVLGRAIATCPVPVLTGIGHETDDSVADRLAHAAYKTPTACAGALVAQAHAFRDRVDQAGKAVGRCARGAVRAESERLLGRARRAATATRSALRIATDELDGYAARVLDTSAATHAADRRLVNVHRGIGAAAGRHLRDATRTVDGLAARAAALDPGRLHARGWSITRAADGRIVRSISDVVAGADVVTTVADGEVRSRVETTEAAP